MKDYITTNNTLSEGKGISANSGKIDQINLVLVGNPNVGKSVLFNALTGLYVDVSNYPGTTVDISQGKVLDFNLIDTPGIYGVGDYNEEEQVARDIILQNNKIINIVSAVSLERDLFLTQQLIDMGYPLVLVVNQLDDAKAKGIKIDFEKLKELLGVNVYQTIATKKEGIETLKNGLKNVKPGNKIDEISKLIKPFNESNLTQAEALLALEGDSSVLEKYSNITFEDHKDEIYSVRRDYINNIVEQCVSETTVGASLSAKIGHLLLNPIIGSISAILVLVALYQIVGVFIAGTVVNFTENLVTTTYIPWAEWLVKTHVGAGWPATLLAGEFGVLTMTIQYIFGVLLPLVIGFYMFFAILEDSGYLPRLAVLFDKFFNFIGLNGKAVIPILLGFGCVTMAIISSRILSSQRERTIAIAILALAVPCSAQLGIIIALLAAAATPWAFIVYLITIVSVMIVISLVLNKYLPGETSGLILDLPPMRFPNFENVVKKSLHKTWLFLLEAGPLFALGTLILGVLSITGTLEWIHELLSPLVVNFLNLPKETASAFIMGLIRRDFGAAGLATMAGIGSSASIMSPIQIVVSIVVITLFVPCIAAVMVMFKERGWLETILLWVFSIILAFVVGGILSFVLNLIF